MVVDVRYHLASLVAVFLAFGLGILVGTSIADEGEAREWQTRWLSALEAELGAIQSEREEVFRLLASTEAERDAYMSFSEALVGGLLRGRLQGERAALLGLGGEPERVDEVAGVLEAAGATIVRRLLVHEGWEARLPEAIALLSPERDGSWEAGEGGGARSSTEFAVAAASALVDEGGSLAAVRSEAVSFDGIDAAPTLLVAVLGRQTGGYASVLEEAARRAGGRRLLRSAMVVGDLSWRPILEGMELSYVTHWGTPFGALSLVVLLGADDAAGGFGMEEGLALWPAHALSVWGSER